MPRSLRRRDREVSAGTRSTCRMEHLVRCGMQPYGSYSLWSADQKARNRRNIPAGGDAVFRRPRRTPKMSGKQHSNFMIVAPVADTGEFQPAFPTPPVFSGRRFLTSFRSMPTLCAYRKSFCRFGNGSLPVRPPTAQALSSRLQRGSGRFPALAFHGARVFLFPVFPPFLRMCL